MGTFFTFKKSFLNLNKIQKLLITDEKYRYGDRAFKLHRLFSNCENLSIVSQTSLGILPNYITVEKKKKAKHKSIISRAACCIMPML